MIPSAGGDYEYLLKGCGDLAGFLFNWTMVVLLIPSGGAIGALAFARYIIEPFFPCHIPNAPKCILAVLAVAFFGALNCMSTRLVKHTQSIAAIGKVFALLLIIVAGIIGFFKGGAHHFENAFEHTEKRPMKYSIAFLSGFFSFSGWNCLNFVTEELKEPQRNLPRSICIGMGSVIVFFVLVNISYMSVLNRDEIIVSEALACDVMARLWRPLGYLMSVLVSLSVFGFLNSFLFTSSRITFDAARNNHMPPVFATINIKSRTPIIAIMTSCTLIIVFVLSGEIPDLVTMSAFADNLWSMVVLISFFHLRKTIPDEKRNLKVPIVFPLTYIVSAAIVSAVSIYVDPKPCGAALILILAGILVYPIAAGFPPRKTIAEYADKLYQFAELITNSALSTKVTAVKNRRISNRGD